MMGDRWAGRQRGRIGALGTLTAAVGAPVRVSPASSSAPYSNARTEVSLGCRRFQIGPAWLTLETTEAAGGADVGSCHLVRQQRASQWPQTAVGLGGGGAGQADWAVRMPLAAAGLAAAPASGRVTTPGSPRSRGGGQRDSGESDSGSGGSPPAAAEPARRPKAADAGGERCRWRRSLVENDPARV